MTYSIENSQALKLLMLASALLIGACSSSSDSSPSIEPTTIDSELNDTTTTIDTNQNIESPSNDPDQGNTSPIVADPESPSLIRVDFEITVPAYVSNSLKVDLTWGEQTMPVQWVGDEVWSASGNLLSNTENLLVVTFFDNNGAITLGNVQTNFKTGTNSAQILPISAEQFSTNVWDSDKDGISNLDESIAGTNPLVDESALLDIRESLDFSVIGNYSVNYYEARLPEQRPYFEHIEESEDCCSTKTITIDINEFGTGTYFTENTGVDVFDRGDKTTTRNTATRTVSEASLTWEGIAYWYNSGAAVGTNNKFNFTTTVLEGLQRSLVGTLYLNSQGTGNPNDSNIVFSLTGEVIEGTERCAPVSGMVSREYYRQRNDDGNTIITITKAAGDRYWKVNATLAKRDGTFAEEYFINDIGTTFQCSFTDLE